MQPVDISNGDKLLFRVTAHFLWSTDKKKIKNYCSLVGHTECHPPFQEES